MTYVHRTMIVPASQADRARDLCEQLAGTPGSGMFTTRLSPKGTRPATHYISAGMVDQDMAVVMASPAAMHAACASIGVPITLAECRDLLSLVEVTVEPARDAMARLGLKTIQTGV